MPDDPKKTEQDRKLVSKQEYEIEEFARKYDLMRGEAAAMIRRYGPSRRKLDAIITQRPRGQMTRTDA
ncbi:hypothetical protein Amn_20570 [Aminobacter sp. Y103A]|jgi:hypothetical protein|uniref:DUF3606 domain-containing protein n=1 Tax=Aminobacter sp. Y103A TaxID=1870862 RepID=UPI0025735628|nr:DUF3606 domain-containing protein [Aminobacter sp. SS-2016]BBD37177.1 hypothetical protein Amn_20570 [Aminobacter sp. SS-2016]